MRRPVPTEAAGTDTDYVEILRGVLKRRKKIVIATLLLIGPVLLGWNLYGQRPLFRSKSVVQIKPSIAEMFPGARDLQMTPNLSVQMTVLKSRRLAQDVLKAVPQETIDELTNENLQPDYFLLLSNRIRTLLGKPPVVSSSHERAMSELRNSRMGFQPVRNEVGRGPTGLIEISATAFKPRLAMDMVNAYVQVLVNWSRQSEQEDVTTTREFLELQGAQVRKDLKESEAAMALFEKEHGVVNLSDHTQFEMARLVRLQGNLAQVQANQEVAQSRLRDLQNALKNSSDTPSVSSDTRITADAARRISARMTELETVLVEMGSKYTEEHPSLIAVREEIQDLRNKLAQLPVSSIPGSQAREAPMSRDDIIRKIAAVKKEELAASREEQSLRIQVDQLRKSLQKLSGRELDYSQLSKSVGSNRALLSFLSEKLFVLRVREQGQGGVVKIIDPPNLPSRPIEGVSLKKLSFLMIVTLGTAGGLGFLIEYIYKPVESEKAVRQQLGLPFLGSALAVPSRRPKSGGRPLFLYGESHRATMPQECYRTIRTNIEAANLRTPFKVIMFSSPCPGEGKSTTAINLAMALRELGRRVLLVDADLRKPSLSSLLRSEVHGGLANLLMGSQEEENTTLPMAPLLEALAVQADPNFAFIPSGDLPADPGALLGSARAREFIAQVKREWDYILIDGPPILVVSDSLLFSTFLDGVILVAYAGRTKWRDLQRATDLLEGAGTRILGVVLNQVPLRQMPYYGAYRTYYGARELHVKDSHGETP